MISSRRSKPIERKPTPEVKDNPEPIPLVLVKHRTRTKKQRAEKPKSQLKDDSDSGQQKSTRRRKGLFGNFAETPLDVLFEIFRHLEPLDLLHLSRTTKDLRAILLQRSSSFIWKSARENVNLPLLPDDMTEPQYASLAFDNYCQNCFKATKLVQWQFRMRICRTCLYWNNDMYVQQIYARSRLYLPIFAFICTLSAYTLSTTDPRELPYELLQCVPRFQLNKKIGHRQRCETFYHTPSINELEEGLCHGRGRWFDRIETSHRRLAKHSDACEKWMSDRAAEHADKLQSLRAARADSVVERLTALGWGKEIEEMDDENVLRRHKLVWQVKPLTDRNWATIEPAMIELMESLKAK